MLWSNKGLQHAKTEFHMENAKELFMKFWRSESILHVSSFFFFFYPHPFLKIASWIWCRVTTFSDCANVYQWQQQKAALTSNCSVDELPVKLPRHTETSSVHRILGVVKQSSNSLMKEPSKLNQSKKERTASIQGSLAVDGWERCSPKTPYAYL